MGRVVGGGGHFIKETEIVEKQRLVKRRGGRWEKVVGREVGGGGTFQRQR